MKKIGFVLVFLITYILFFFTEGFAGISASAGYIYKDYNFSQGDVNAQGVVLSLNYTHKGALYLEGTGKVSKGDVDVLNDGNKDLKDNDYSVEAGVHIYERGTFLTYSAAIKYRYWKIKIDDVLSDKTQVFYLIPIRFTLAGNIRKNVRIGVDLAGQIPVWDKENVRDLITDERYKLDNFIDSNIILAAFLNYKKFRLEFSWNYEPTKSTVELNNGAVTKYDKTVNNYMVLLTYRF